MLPDVFQFLILGYFNDLSSSFSASVLSIPHFRIPYKADTGELKLTNFQFLILGYRHRLFDRG